MIIQSKLKWLIEKHILKKFKSGLEQFGIYIWKLQVEKLTEL